MSKIWGIPSPKIGVPKPPFSTTSQLNGKFNTIYLRKNSLYITMQMRWKLQGVSYIVSKCHKLWTTDGLKLDPSVYPPSVNSASYFIARLCRRKSANGAQPNFARRCAVIAINRTNNLQTKSRGRPSQTVDAKKFYICLVLMVNIFWKKRDRDHRGGTLECTNGPLHIPKFHEVWSTNGLKLDMSFYPPSVFCSFPTRSKRH